jgi:hypothetical protein
VLRCSFPYIIVIERHPPKSFICLLLTLLVDFCYDLNPGFLDPGEDEPAAAYKLGIFIIVPCPDYLKLLSSSFILMSF